LIKKKIYIWASDYSNFTGEGNLGRLFVNLRLKKKYKITISRITKNNNIINKVFSHKYILPAIGVISCWKYFLLGKKICFLNYLPLWNFLIFLLLPPSTILGPITGGSYFKKEMSINYFVRKFIFPIFYTITSLILTIRNFDTIFSTNLLKSYLNKNLKKKSEFNFVLNALNLQKKSNIKKNLQFLIYYKKHKNKLSLYPIKFVRNLIKLNFKILVIGDKLKIPGVKNLGYLNRKKLKQLLLKSKYAILSNENIYSFFAIECLNSNMKLITNNSLNHIDKKLKEKFIYFNPKKINKLRIKEFSKNI
tara:strand:+ start:3313 stop:4230 length:918 start_codon:yes stop_codon:yes gene_type:complete